VRKERYQLVGLRNKNLQDGFSSELIDSIGAELEQGNQVLVFINRRGFAPVFYCADCQWIASCRRCDAKMTCHLADRSLMCHHCGTRTPLPKHCNDCQSTQVVPLGLGTQRVEDSLQQLFPSFPVLRVDRDSTRKKGSLEKVVKDLQSGKPCILVGTQMLAKGHHFPDVTLVAMLDIDSGFYSADFKSLEKTGQLILQVGGRAGRASKPGKVILQSQFTDHPLLQSLIIDGYEAFSNSILKERKENRLPPFSFHCLIRAESTNKQLAMAFLDDIVKNTSPVTSVETLGPIPALMEKRAGRYRSQLLIESASRSALHQAVRQLVATAETSKLSNRVRWSVDVDPVELF
jgi:primosomal protein N' (replication factor Y)